MPDTTGDIPTPGYHPRPLVIGVGGSNSGAGKTTVACAVLNALVASKLPHALVFERWGAIKYTKTELFTSLTDDRSVVDRKDKDTGKLLDAGAEEVLWVQGPADGIEETVSMAIDRLSHLDGIVIEGNSAIEFSNPDIVIFILGSRRIMEKPSAARLIKHADIILLTKDGRQYAVDEDIPAARTAFYDPENESAERELLTLMDEVIKDHMFERIKLALKDKAVDGRITCAVARQIADELKAPYREVGRAANELKIKVKNCELGCF